MAYFGATHKNKLDLPDNKDFHLFVSYSSENVGQVRTIVDNLEKQGVYCCYSDRDFTPGAEILENTNKGMKRSVGTLLVLTEGFVKSTFCKFELSQAMHMRIDESYVLIPIKLEPCVVPERLRTTISYIDAEDIPIDQVHVNIVKALVDREIQKEQKESNGISVKIQLKAHRRTCLSLSRYRLDDHLDAIQLHTLNVYVPNEVWEKIKKMVNESDIVKYRHMYRSSSFVCIITSVVVFVVLLVIVVFFLVLLLTTSTDSPQKAITPAGAFLAICIPVLVLLSICSCCIFSIMYNTSSESRHGYPNNYIQNFIIQERRRLNQKLWDEINLDSDDIHRCFVFFQNDSLVMMKFNLGPCKDLFKRNLDRKPDLLKYKMTEESHEAYTDRVFRTYLRYNVHMLTETTTKLRHRNVSNAKCVCLLAEEWINDN